MRIFYASDIHGSEPCFKKFINAASFYNAQVLILGGDLAGKALLPIVDQGKGVYKAFFGGKDRIMKKPSEVEELENEAKINGFYPKRMAPEEEAIFKEDPQALDDAFERLIDLSLKQWLDFAEERLPKNVECYIMPGNDDTPAVEEALSHSVRIVNSDGKKIVLGEMYEMISLGLSNRTPFDSPREVDEYELRRRLEDLAGQIEQPGKAIYNIHCPPFGTALDLAPKVNDELRIVTTLGRPNMIHVGSKAILEIIKERQPLLSLHGHCHESRGKDLVGKTICFNPGSEYNNGILTGLMLNINSMLHVSYQFVSA